MEKKLQEIYGSYYNLLIVQDLWPAHYQISNNNLSEGIHRIKCKYGRDDKKCRTCGIKNKHCDCFLDYTNFKEDLIKYKCFSCNKNYQQKFNEK